jgi:NADP-dependent 3-hydroxy acid dehydrogenase YdfG
VAVVLHVPRPARLHYRRAILAVTSLTVLMAAGVTAVPAVHTTLERFRRVDILVNNAGSTSNSGPLHDMTDKTWDETMDVFLRGVFRFSRAVIPHMVQ